MKSMYYSEPQTELLSLLKTLGGMWKRQVYMLLGLRFGMDKKAVDRTIRQLRYGGVLRDMGAYVLAADRRFDIQLARAVDISLALSGSRAPDIFPRKKPVFLTAYLPEREVRLCVLYIPVGKERKRCLTLDSLRVENTMKTLYALLLDEAGQVAALRAETPCLLVWPDKNEKLELKKWEGIRNE